MREYVYRIQSLYTFSRFVCAATATATAAIQNNLKMLPCCLLQQIIEKHYKCWLGRLFKRYRLQYNSVPMFSNPTFPYVCYYLARALIAQGTFLARASVWHSTFELSFSRSLSLLLSFASSLDSIQYNQPHAQDISWKNE